jgi:prophage regulatory protein
MRNPASKKHDTAKKATRKSARVPRVPVPAQITTVLLSEREVCSVLGLGRVTLWKMRTRGQFPQPVQLSPNRKGWLASTINEWIAARAAVSA